MLVLLQRSVMEAALVVALDHIILPVADAERSVRFYYKTLGFKYEPVALVRVSPTTVLQLIQRAPETSQHLAFSMSRVEFDRTLERLKADGIPFGDDFEPRPVQVIGFEAAFGREGFQQQNLEHAPGNPHHALIFADADAELDSVPVGVPPGVGRKSEKHRPPGVFC